MIKQLLILVLLLLLGQTTLLAQQWTDSLHVRISGDTIKTVSGKHVLEFDIEIFRPNDDWLSTDELLGASSFVFGEKLDELYTDPMLEWISPSFNGTKLSMTTTFVDHRVVVDINKNSDNPSFASFPIPLKVWIKLCRVRLSMKDPTIISLGIKWHSQTAMSTEKFSPIILTTLGEIDASRDTAIRFETPRRDTSLLACERTDVSFVAKAISTSGGRVSYAWRDSVKNQAAEPLLIGGRLVSLARGFQYEIFNGGDSLVVYNAPASIDTAWFICKAQDLTLGPDEAKNAKTVKFELKLRDRLPTVLTDASDIPGTLLKSADTVLMCPGSDAKVMVAFLYEGGKAEMRAERDVIHVAYEGWVKPGEWFNDTVHIDVTSSSFLNSYKSHTIGGRKQYIYSSPITLTKPGRYYIKNVWTNVGCTEEIVSMYDTVIVKESAAVRFDLDEVTMVVKTDSLIVPQELVGVVDCADLDNMNGAIGWLDGCKYNAENVGQDTVIYTYISDGCEITANQSINVVDKYYLSLNVMLEGAYMKAPRDSMKCMVEGYFPGTVNEYESPYADKLKTPKPFLNFGHKVTDWICVELWDYPPNGIGTSDSRRGKLVTATSALLLSDGTVCSVDGKKYLSFTGLSGGAYYVAIKHRNHLSVLSSLPVALTTTTPSTVAWNFTHAGMSFGADAMVQVGGRFLMYAGDTDMGGWIDVADMNRVTFNEDVIGYSAEDIDITARVDVNDQNLIIKNLGIIRKY